MIVVVADEADAEAAGLTERWADAGAVLLTPHDLSRDGWEVRFPGAGPRFVAGARALPAADVSGVLVRLPGVAPYHLAHLRAEDRDYASSEMTAFLAYWLTALDCPVVNRPSPAYLVGPAWSNTQWLTIAARAGVPVCSVCVDERTAPALPGELEWAAVVGERVIGGSPAQGAAAAALARHGGVSLLCAGFDETHVPARLAAVSVRPPLTSPVADALLAILAAPSPVILLWGLAEDPPLACVRAVLDARALDYAFVDQRAPPTAYRFDFGPSLAGRIGELDLETVSAAFIRPSDYGSLPQHAGAPDAAQRVPQLRRFAHHLTEWLELAPILVVNRFSAQASNTSKLYQQRLIAEHRFAVPASLATTRAQAARAFRREHGDVIYKSLSSVRSIVSRLDDERLERLEDVESCPTLFQQQIAGTDYRAHVVGDAVLATMLASAEDDYRYDGFTERVPVTLPQPIARRCVDLSRSLGLAFSGVDLRRANDGRWHCFEVNPSPAFPYFEPPGTALIAESLVDLLATASPDSPSDRLRDRGGTVDGG